MTHNGELPYAFGCALFLMPLGLLLHDELLKKTTPEKVLPPPRSPPCCSQKLSSPGLIVNFVHISKVEFLLC